MRIHLQTVSCLPMIFCCITNCPEAGPSPSFDHSVFDQLLREAVRDGVVDYGRITQRYQDLQLYLTQISAAPFRSLPKEEQIAIAINAYNAACINGVLKAGKIRSVNDVDSFFKNTKVTLGGREMDLDGLENNLLRKMGEPRIHFAIVCASKSCPKLASQAYRASNLDADLDRAAREFFQDPTKNRLDRENKILYLSSILNWFKDDFTAKASSVGEFARQYLSREDRAFLVQNQVKVQFLEYDWSLNGHF